MQRMLFTSALIAIVLVAVTFIYGYHTTTGGVDAMTAIVGFDPEPLFVGEAVVTVVLVDTRGRGIPGAAVQVTGQVAQGEHTPVAVRADEIAPGVYSVQTEITQSGDWTFIVRARVPDGRFLERSFPGGFADEVCDPLPGGANPATTPTTGDAAPAEEQ